MSRLRQISIALDQLANAFTRDGWADETISAHAWRKRGDPDWDAWRRFIDRLFFWQSEHCRQAFDAEVLRRQSPPEHRIPKKT